MVIQRASEQAEEIKMEKLHKDSIQLPTFFKICLRIFIIFTKLVSNGVYFTSKLVILMQCKNVNSLQMKKIIELISQDTSC